MEASRRMVMVMMMTVIVMTLGQEAFTSHPYGSYMSTARGCGGHHTIATARGYGHALGKTVGG